MRLTVLGCWSPFPAPGEACPGYLLEHEGYRVLLECGSGVLGQLGLHTPLETLDAVVLSHLHADHAADALILRYAVAALQRLGERRAPLAIYAPGQPAEEFRRLSYPEAMAPHSISPREPLSLGPFTFAFLEARHQLPTLCMKVSAGGRSLAYSADSGMCDQLLTVAQQADALLCEASLRDEDSDELQQGHLTGTQAGTVALQAGANRLLLTHLFPRYSPAGRRDEARKVFTGAVEVVRTGATYLI